MAGMALAAGFRVPWTIQHGFHSGLLAVVKPQLPCTGIMHRDTCRVMQLQFLQCMPKVGLIGAWRSVNLPTS